MNGNTGCVGRNHQCACRGPLASRRRRALFDHSLTAPAQHMSESRIRGVGRGPPRSHQQVAPENRNHNRPSYQKQEWLSQRGAGHSGALRWNTEHQACTTCLTPHSPLSSHPHPPHQSAPPLGAGRPSSAMLFLQGNKPLRYPNLAVISSRHWNSLSNRWTDNCR